MTDVASGNDTSRLGKFADLAAVEFCSKKTGFVQKCKSLAGDGGVLRGAGQVGQMSVEMHHAKTQRCKEGFIADAAGEWQE